MPPRTMRGRRRVEITVPMLAAASGLTRQTMLRRLRELGVPLHRRGVGKVRAHVFVTWAELEAHAPHVLDEVTDWNALIKWADEPEEES